MITGPKPKLFYVFGDLHLNHFSSWEEFEVAGFRVLSFLVSCVSFFVQIKPIVVSNVLAGLSHVVDG